MESKYIFGVVVTKGRFVVKLEFKVSALCKYMGHFSLDTFDLVTGTFRLFFLETRFHLLAIFSLLTYSDFQACIYKCLNILLQMRLMESNNSMGLSWWNDQI